eukprot:TRINITY_DN7193_c0_g5_i1.p2 TRINITY_DN7193_c0_g5~~TRINITY_DN7193_c0_g5_i1.p2  ORF type:complete len:361 (-),score=102.97 TRINITY_DN7193_c0_g5_i1:58-1140(-)
MKRRAFLTTASVGVAATTIAAPAIAQSNPEVKWRCASSFPKSLDTIFGGAEFVAKRVAELTEGKFQIRVFAGGEIVPPLQVLDAVKDNTIECGHTVSYYYVGKDPTFAFDSAMPFGLNARQQNAWMTHGGGMELMREFFAGYNIVQFAAGNTGTQMGGWFRKEIKTVEDLKGLKFRIGGYAGTIMSKLGVVPQQIGGGDIYPALEKGTIDAAEWVGPYDDEKLGFNKVAPYYYYPGWWEGGADLEFFINVKKFNALSDENKAILNAAMAVAATDMTAKYDAYNPIALKKLVAEKTQLKAFPKAVMDAGFKSSMEVFADHEAKSPEFKAIHQSMRAFQRDQILWNRFSEYPFNQYMNGVKI